MGGVEEQWLTTRSLLFSHKPSPSHPLHLNHYICSRKCLVSLINWLKLVLLSCHRCSTALSIFQHVFWHFFDLPPSSCDIKKKEIQSVSKIKRIGEHRKLEREKNIFSQDLTTKHRKLNRCDTASPVSQRIALEIKAKELM